jgi:hypothetical protein
VLGVFVCSSKVAAAKEPRNPGHFHGMDDVFLTNRKSHGLATDFNVNRSFDDYLYFKKRRPRDDSCNVRGIYHSLPAADLGFLAMVRALFVDDFARNAGNRVLRLFMLVGSTPAAWR